MNMKKNNKGITLVALAVTIIVLIILAGVSIRLAIGDNGILSESKRTKENAILAQTEKETQLNELYVQLEENQVGNETEILKVHRRPFFIFLFFFPPFLF